ncbi:MAG: LacI family DNA-binding transcriptional regulator, partial [Candidatus Nanopelagicaceae bacterium]
MPLLLFDSDMENRSRKGVREVAKLAQVSIGTVSNVINRPELVSPETVQRVEE